MFKRQPCTRRGSRHATQLFRALLQLNSITTFQPDSSTDAGNRIYYESQFSCWSVHAIRNDRLPAMQFS